MFLDSLQKCQEIVQTAYTELSSANTREGVRSILLECSISYQEVAEKSLTPFIFSITNMGRAIELSSGAKNTPKSYSTKGDKSGFAKIANFFSSLFSSEKSQESLEQLKERSGNALSNVLTQLNRLSRAA